MDKSEVKVYFDAPDPKVIARKSALLKKFNYECTTREERESVVRELFRSVGKRCSITPLFYCDYGHNITVGDFFYSNYNLTILDCAPVTIGNNVYIAPNVGLYAVGHPIDPVIRRSGVEFCAPIVIGNDVWIGGHVVVNPGVTIGDRSVIGSGSVVTQDIPEDSVAVGTPCKVIRKVNDKDKKYFFRDFEYPKALLDEVYKRY